MNRLTFKISGMTCGGCTTKVKKALNALPQIKSVMVDLESKEAVIETVGIVNLFILQQELSKVGKYKIKPLFQKEKPVQNNSRATSEIRQLFPLFLIFGYITIASILMNIEPTWNANSFMLDFMGLFYIVFSFFKLLDLKGFPDSFRMYDPLAKAIPMYAWIYPFIEVALGLLFLFRFQIQFALITTLVILGITTIGVTKILFDKKSIQCACLGTALKLPMTKATFIENAIMIVMAVIMLLKN